MNKKLILVIVMVFTIITTYGFYPMNKQAQRGQGQGQGKGRQEFRQGPGGAMGIFQIKDLTDEQKSQINDIMYSHRLQSLDTKNELEKNQLKLDQLMKADSPDKAAILNLVSQNGDLQTELQKSRIEMMFDIKALLTAEQLEEFNKMPMPGRGMGMGMGRFDGDGQQAPRMGMGMRGNNPDCPFNDFPQPPQPPQPEEDEAQE